MTVGAEWVSVAGEIDVARECELRERLSRAAERAGTAGLVVDVRGVSFIDCAGLQVLLTARQQVEAAGGRLVLAGPSPAVSRLLGLTDLSQVLPVLDDA